MRLYHQQAEKSDHKRTWAGISNPCTVIKSLHEFSDLVLGAGDSKKIFEGGMGENCRGPSHICFYTGKKLDDRVKIQEILERTQRLPNFVVGVGPQGRSRRRFDREQKEV
jgi:hypothetical protein